MKDILVTGFGPFGKFRDNPSDVLATLMPGVEGVVLSVTFGAGDRFTRNRFPRSIGAIVMLGVAERGRKLRLERRARNWVGGSPDVFEVTRGPGPISHRGQEYLEGTLFDGWEDTDLWALSDDAGSCLCNYLYYRVLERHPSARCGFVHLLPFSSRPLQQQLEWPKALIDEVRARL